MADTIFFRTWLDDAEGFETVQHRGPSNIDHFTIAQAEHVPLDFLRGFGLPDLIIDNIGVLRGDAIQYYSCFISYSSANEDFAKRLYADLQDEGIRCWFAPEDLKGGQKTHHQINEAIRYFDKLVLVLSEASMNSNWVEHEIRQARKQEREREENGELDAEDRVLFPISLIPFDDLRKWTLFNADEGRDLAEEIREYYIPGFVNWKDHEEYRSEFKKLVEALRTASVTDKY